MTEYVDGCALSEFVKRAHEYLSAEKLSRDEYSECIKGVMWQLVHTVKWLHSTMKCAHMDLCCDNVMVSGVHFVPNDEDDTVRLEGKAVIKLIDFGVAEVETLSPEVGTQSMREHALQCEQGFTKFQTQN